jgi:glycine/D-amino acid oxidase-like deaminating enzyme
MLPRLDTYDIVIIGGGFFGAYLAQQLKSSQQQAYSNKKILIVEREDDLLKRASLANQARVHGGYHYPRSLVTGLRSQENYRLFIDSFSDCVHSSFNKYYAISKGSSSVTAQQFKFFCNRIGASLKKAPLDIEKEFNAALIEEVFTVEECAFNADKLRAKMKKQLSETDVEVCTTLEAVSIDKIDTRNEFNLTVQEVAQPEKLVSIKCAKIFLCTYSLINRILSKSALPQIAIRNELAEMCLVKPCGFLENAGVTVMCGPFFSIMPYPARNLHTLSHVRYTPHFSWEESDSLGVPQNVPRVPVNIKSHYMHMLKDAQRYLPALRELEYVESLWEHKTLLPRNEMDDARPILLKENHGYSNLTCIIGAKIDNVFDVCSALGL